MRKQLLLACILLIFIVSPLKSIDFPQITGWNTASDVKVYNPDNLFDYINGAADHYLSYGFQSLLSRELSQGDVTIIADIYDMGSPLNAFGIYRSERPRDQKIYRIGTEAIITPPYQCLLLKDAYYIKINVMDGDITEEIGIPLLEQLANALPGETSYPEALQLLPAQHKIPNTENFVREGFLGMSVLKNCVYATYQTEKKDVRCFVIIPEADETNELIWMTFTEKWDKLEHQKHTIHYKNIPYTGLTGVILHDQNILGITDCDDEEQLIMFLEMMVNSR